MLDLFEQSNFKIVSLSFFIAIFSLFVCHNFFQLSQVNMSSCMYLDCPKCKSTLQYPSHAKLIRCPSCHYVANTTAPQHLPCISCHTLLTFPPHSSYIRCPKCFVTIQFRDHQYKNELLNHNKFITHDITLPTIDNNSNIKCNNPECSSKDNRITYIKYDNVDMKYLYICNNCGLKWKNNI